MTHSPKVNYPAIGELVKVHLPGESPYAECLSVSDGYWLGRIENKLFSEYTEAERTAWLQNEFSTMEPLPKLHDFKKGDVLRFEPDETYSFWEGYKHDIQ